MHAVCEPWDGPLVDGVSFSEDDTEDFTDWVVSQGASAWHRACEADDLAELAREYQAARRAPTWDIAVTEPAYGGWQTCKAIAYAVYERVHGGDLLDALDET